MLGSVRIPDLGHSCLFPKQQAKLILPAQLHTYLSGLRISSVPRAGQQLEVPLPHSSSILLQ